MTTFGRGDRGPGVVAVRARLVGLGLLPDGADVSQEFDGACETAVRSFQQRRGISVDGIVGADTWRVLEEARWALGDRLLVRSVSRPLSGDDVAALQERLAELGFGTERADGVFGAGTEQALREFQRNYGLVPDGACGPATLRALHMLVRSVRGGEPHRLREDERLRRASPSLAGKVVVLDPGHGGHDRGVVVGDLCEADITHDIAARVEGRLIAGGATVYRTHGRARAVPQEACAAFANSCDADLVLSLHCDGADSPRCSGVAAYHFGTADGRSSAVGERLAGLLQREVVARTGMMDCRTHARAWSLLRRTRMPAVRLEAGYLTSPADRVRLVDPETRDRIADAALVAVQRMYLPPERDVPTGRLRAVDVA